MCGAQSAQKCWLLLNYNHLLLIYNHLLMIYNHLFSGIIWRFCGMFLSTHSIHLINPEMAQLMGGVIIGAVDRNHFLHGHSTFSLLPHVWQ